MGLITGIYNMVRQSEMDEMNKRAFEDRMKREERAYQNALRSQEREADVTQGITEIGRLKENASRLRIEATLAEQEGQKRFASMDPESGRFFGAASGLNTQAELMEGAPHMMGFTPDVCAPPLLLLLSPSVPLSLPCCIDPQHLLCACCMTSSHLTR